MEKEVRDFLDSQQVGCLAVRMEDGTPHTAAVHFSVVSQPQVKLFFQTDTNSKKCEPLQNEREIPASFTAGFSEEEWKTIQMDGMVRFITPDEDEEFERTHYTKHPEAKKYRGDDTSYLVFTPHWWRFTDFNAEDLPRIITN